MPDRLVKYCERRFNAALDAQTLQLGTLEYYRSLDPKFAIADPGEATHTINFKEGLELSVDANLSNHLFGGGVGATGGDLKMVAGPGAQFSTTVGNAYIFCVSRCTDDDPPSLEHAARLDPRYDSMWEINDQRAFRDALGSALLEVITINHLSPFARQALCGLPLKDLTLQVHMLDKPVHYIEAREHEISDPADIARVPNYNEALEHAIFRKTRKDEHQREHRFVYMVTNPRLGHLSVTQEPIRIPLNRLHLMVSSIPR